MQSSLPDHTEYRPKDLAALGRNRLPIVVWANGGCADDGTAFRWFLSEISSYGFFVVANGPIGADPHAFDDPVPRPMRPVNAAQLPPPATHTSELIDAINWAIAENSRAGSALQGRLETDKIAVMGQSCGGVQAIEASRDPRVSTTMVWNSGLLPQPTRMGGGKLMDKRDLTTLHGPAAYISGDTRDVAYLNANDDFGRLTHLPVFRAFERGVPHIATYWEPNGGEFGGVAVAWLLWQLSGDRTAAKMFTGEACGLCVNPRWVVRRKNLR